jgi:mevalonate kinase
MATASAPGEILLFGEHVGAYGQPCIAIAVDRRATVSVERSRERRISSRELGTLVAKGKKLSGNREMLPVYECAAAFLSRHGIREGFSIRIASDIPTGSGMASSSALGVALIAALSREFGVSLTRRQVRDYAFELFEQPVHGGGSKIGTSVAAFGGCVLLRGGEAKQISACELPVVVGWTGVKSPTGIMVAKVRRLREEYPAAAGAVMEAIGSIVRRAVPALQRCDVETLGVLANLNQRMLVALGVSCREIDALVSAALAAGAPGAKISGAGGGGIMYALGNSNKIAAAIKKAGGTPMRVRLGVEGVRIEKASG